MKKPTAPAIPDDARPLTLKQAADLFGRDRSCVLRWVMSGQLKAGRLGRSYYVSVAAVRDALARGVA